MLDYLILLSISYHSKLVSNILTYERLNSLQTCNRLFTELQFTLTSVPDVINCFNLT